MELSSLDHEMRSSLHSPLTGFEVPNKTDCYLPSPCLIEEQSISLLKPEIHQNNTHTARLRYKHELVNAVWGYNFCLPQRLYETRKHTLWAKC
jgi:hypothetical protein